MWPETQTAFAAALLDPMREGPPGVAEDYGRPARDRVAVYRNNVIKGLCDALRDGFPVVAELVGDEFFDAMASAFVRAHPPASPVLLHYGRDFPDFIAGFEPADVVPYLADVAGLEQARTEAYHAADAEPLGIDALQGLSDERLSRMRLDLHPSLRLMASEWPVVSIWQAHQGLDPVGAGSGLPHTGDCALVLRPGWTVEVRAVAAPVHAFVRALGAGAPLGEALERLDRADAPDPSSALAELFHIGAVAGLADTHNETKEDLPC
jgi:hypothetical protein